MSLKSPEAPYFCCQACAASGLGIAFLPMEIAVGDMADSAEKLQG